MCPKIRWMDENFLGGKLNRALMNCQNHPNQAGRQKNLIGPGTMPYITAPRTPTSVHESPRPAHFTRHDIDRQRAEQSAPPPLVHSISINNYSLIINKSKQTVMVVRPYLGCPARPVQVDVPPPHGVGIH